MGDWGGGSVVERAPSTHKDLGSIPAEKRKKSQMDLTRLNSKGMTGCVLSEVSGEIRFLVFSGF
jgi:hypothetical protein